MVKSLTQPWLNWSPALGPIVAAHPCIIHVLILINYTNLILIQLLIISFPIHIHPSLLIKSNLLLPFIIKSDLLLKEKERILFLRIIILFTSKIRPTKNSNCQHSALVVSTSNMKTFSILLNFSKFVNTRHTCVRHTNKNMDIIQRGYLRNV